MVKLEGESYLYETETVALLIRKSCNDLVLLDSVSPTLFPLKVIKELVVFDLYRN